MKIWLGIDPGATGGICVLNEDGEIYLEAYSSRVHDTIYDRCRLAENTTIRMAIIEKQQAFPGQGVSSMFSLGVNYGGYLAALALFAIPYELVRPAEWQKGMMLKTKKGPQHKREIADVISRKYPTAEIWGPRGGLLDGLSDALAIADYARRTYP